MSETRTFLQKLEIGLNTLNHCLIAFCAFYTFWYLNKYGFDKPHTWHVFWSATGFQLLLAEGILAMYSGNTFSLFATRREKKWLHVLLQATGGIFGLIGFFLEVVQRLQNKETLWHIWHAKFGLVAAIFLGFSVVSGLFILYPRSYKNYVPPVYIKFCHILFTITSFVCGFISILIAYNTQNLVQYVDPGNLRFFMMAFLSSILAITLIGPLKSFYRNFKFLCLSSAPSERIQINGHQTNCNYNTTNGTAVELNNRLNIIDSQI